VGHRGGRNALIHDEVLQGHVTRALEALADLTLEAATVVRGNDLPAVQFAGFGVERGARVLEARLLVEP